MLLEGLLELGVHLLPKNILNLVSNFEPDGLHECAQHCQEVVEVDKHLKTHFTHMLISTICNTVTTKKIVFA